MVTQRTVFGDDGDPFYSPGAGAEFTWRCCSIYCGLIVIGMCLESLSLGAARKIIFCKTNCFGNIGSVCDKQSPASPRRKLSKN